VTSSTELVGFTELQPNHWEHDSSDLVYGYRPDKKYCYVGDKVGSGARFTDCDILSWEQAIEAILNHWQGIKRYHGG